MSVDLVTFLKALPKVELHAHINGSVSETTVKKLIDLRTRRNDTSHDWTKAAGIIQKGQKRTLAQCFDIFALIHQLCDSEEAAYMVTKDVIKEFSEENVKYIELRTTPRAEERTGMTKESYVKSVLRGIEECRESGWDTEVRLLLSVDRRRGVQDGYDTIRLAEQFQNHSHPLVAGVDLSGDPAAGNEKDFFPMFQDVRRRGIRIAMHLAEIPDRNEETKVLLGVPPDRIGHGTHLHQDMGGTQDIIDTVSNLKIPIEACITSNVCLQTVRSVSDHQFGYWYQRGHPCVICTDDKGVFDTSLTDEYRIAAETFSLSRQQLYDVAYDAISATFAGSDLKTKLQKSWELWRNEHEHFFNETFSNK